MDFDYFPVVIISGRVSVAVPIKILIQESPRFKALFDSSSKSRDCDSGNSSLCENENGTSTETISITVKDLQERISIDDDLMKKHGKEETSNDTCIDDVTRINPENNNKTDQPEWKKEKQIDLIDMSTFNQNSVKILFLYLQGIPDLLESCTSLTDLYGVLQICSEYGIPNSLQDILSKIKTCDVITISNLIKALDIVENIKEIENYGDIAEALFQRCVTYARFNFASWQVIIKLMMKHKEKVHLILQLLKELKDGSEAKIRFSIAKFSKKSGVISPIFIVKNLEWKLEIYQSKDGKWASCVIHCTAPKQNKSWTCNATIQLRIHHKSMDDGKAHHKDISQTFCSASNKTTISEFISLDDIQNINNGYIKEDTILFEAKICVESVEGLPTCLGVTEKDIGWFDNTVVKDELKEAHCYGSQMQEVDTCAQNEVVLVICENIVAAIQQSCLIKESQVFRTLLLSDMVTYYCEDKPIDEEIQSTTKVDMSIRRTRHIHLNGFKPKAVKILVEYLQGYHDMLSECHNILELCDILKLCNEYKIFKPQQEVIDKILSIEVSIFNVVELFAVAEMLGQLESFTSVSSNLFSKCVTYLRYNLSSWNVLINFVVDNVSNIDLVLKILQQLAEQKVAKIRLKLKDVCNKLDVIVETKPFIHRNILWSFEFGSYKAGFVTCYLWHELDDSNGYPNFCYGMQHMKIHQTTTQPSSGLFGPFLLGANDFKAEERIEDSCIWEVIENSNGFVKDDCLNAVIEINTEEPTLPSHLGVAENMVI